MCLRSDVGVEEACSTLLRVLAEKRILAEVASCAASFSGRNASSAAIKETRRISATIEALGEICADSSRFFQVGPNDEFDKTVCELHRAYFGGGQSSCLVIRPFGQIPQTKCDEAQGMSSEIPLPGTPLGSERTAARLRVGEIFRLLGMGRVESHLEDSVTERKIILNIRVPPF